MPPNSFISHFIINELSHPTTPRERFDDIVDEYNSDNPLHFATIFVRTHSLQDPMRRGSLVFNAEAVNFRTVDPAWSYYPQENPLQFAVDYNREYNPQHVHIPVPRLVFENPYTVIEIDRMTEMYRRRTEVTESMTRRFMDRILRHMRAPRSITVEAVSDIHVGDIVRTTEEGSVVGVDTSDVAVATALPNSINNNIVGVAVSVNRQEDGDNLVEVRLQGEVSVPIPRYVSPSINANVRDQLDRLQDEIASAMSFSVNAYPHNTDAEDRAAIRNDRHIEFHCDCPNCNPPKSYKKYFSAKMGLKRAKHAKTGNSMMFIGGHRVDADQYNGCMECFWYSIVFYAKASPEGTVIIETDEDFEKVKGHFVRHFNKKHRDVVAKKMALKNAEKMT